MRNQHTELERLPFTVLALSQQVQELLGSQAGGSEQSTENEDRELTVVRNDQRAFSGHRQLHVITPRTPMHPPSTLERLAGLLPGDTR